MQLRKCSRRCGEPKLRNASYCPFDEDPCAIASSSAAKFSPKKSSPGLKFRPAVNPKRIPGPATIESGCVLVQDPSSSRLKYSNTLVIEGAHSDGSSTGTVQCLAPIKAIRSWPLSPKWPRSLAISSLGFVVRPLWLTEPRFQGQPARSIYDSQ